MSRTGASSRDTATRRGVAAEELRRHNLAAVLERLHLSGPQSRSELTARTGLNRSTVADLIGELTALGLAEEGPAPATSGPGRPSPLVRARPQGAAVLAVWAVPAVLAIPVCIPACTASRVVVRVPLATARSMRAASTSAASPAPTRARATA